jgi:hypothetical protein
LVIGARLPFEFDPGRLRADLAQVRPEDWAPHYNERDYGGDWRGAALRSGTGAVTDLRAVAPSYTDTPLLDRCPHFRDAIARFDCAVKAVRLLSLAAGSYIREHTDNALQFEDGEVRIHIPVQTNDAVEFYVAGKRLALDAGGAYYVNVNLPHRVNNRGAADRIHLVVDLAVNDWLRDLFAGAGEIRVVAETARGVDAFRETAAGVPELQDIDDPDEFASSAARLGRERGFEFHEGDVDAVLRGPARPGRPGGLPVSIDLRDGGIYATWIHDQGPLTEPFFADSVRTRMRRPFTRFTRREAPVETAGPPPAGLVFHLSRCGSTLLSAMFTAAGYRVIREAPAIDEVLGAGNPAWVRRVVTAFGDGQPYIVKLDSWNIHRLPLIQEAFPGAPWMFLFRDPVEVMASHLRLPGKQALPGAIDPGTLGMTLQDVTSLSRGEWLARVLAGICRSAVAGTEGLFVDYRQLPDAAWDRIGRHFGLSLTRSQVEAMRGAALIDAKRPSLTFQDDTAQKRHEGSGLQAIIHAAGLDRLYGELRSKVVP